MTEENVVRVGIFGTSWWADAMYAPALANHPGAKLVAACGRDQGRTDAFAVRWNIPHRFVDPEALFDSGLCDAVIVATTNDAHYRLTMKALDLGLHVLCEKPLAHNYRDAAEMALRANEKGVRHLVPYTYRFLPPARYLKQLIDDGYIGRPFHLNLRYYTGFGRQPGYKWRFDNQIAGSGVIGDIGSHFLYLAEWYFGEIASLSCQLGFMVDRGAVAPDGRPIDRGDDHAIVTLTFANGAQGVVHISSLAYEDTPFGQSHHMEFHGSRGTLYYTNDWDRTQQLSGAQVGEGMVQPISIPDSYWGSARRDTVHNTYRDVFREDQLMIGEFIDAIVADQPVEPNFDDGARIQRVIDAAIKSHREGRRVAVASVS